MDRINSLVDNVKLMKSNPHYRLGDLIFNEGLRWKEDREVILSSSIFENTFLRKYLERLNNPKVDPLNVSALRQTLFDFLKDGKLNRQNTLYIHLRSGDIVMDEEGDKMGLKNWNSNYFLINQDRLMDCIQREISKKSQIDEIIIVTAMHFGDNQKHDLWKYNDYAYKKNRSLMKVLLRRIQNNTGLNINIMNNDEDDIANVDRHFILLVSCENVILDEGNFSQLISESRSILNLPRKIDNVKNIMHGCSKYHIHNGWDNACSLFLEDPNGSVDFRVFLDFDLGWTFDKVVVDLESFDKFIGFMHVPLSVGDFTIMGKPFHKDILEMLKKKCLGLFFLSETEKNRYEKYLRSMGVNIPCEALIHPAQDLSSYSFNWEEFSKNRVLLNSGKFGRKIYSIFSLKVPSNYTKSVVPWTEKKQAQLIREKERGLYTEIDIDSVKLIHLLPYSEYLKFYTNSVIYLDLYDVVACNTVVDCIATKCPIILNRLPANEEYLGKDYPLFFDSPDEVHDMLCDDELLLSAHRYLREMDKSKFTPRYFVDSFFNSKIYRGIQND